MSRSSDTTHQRKLSFPRVSGDEPQPFRLGRGLVVFSPRERG